MACVGKLSRASAVGNRNRPSEKPRGLSSTPLHPPSPTPTPLRWGLVLAAVTGRWEIRSRVSPLRLFLAVCPHGLLCLDTLTTGSCEGATFWPAASVRVSRNFSHASLCLCRCFPSTSASKVRTQAAKCLKMWCSKKKNRPLIEVFVHVGLNLGAGEAFACVTVTIIKCVFFRALTDRESSRHARD